ncbi:MAG: ATP-binding cassette domain-containing protein [Kiritimatiellia bacterium]
MTLLDVKKLVITYPIAGKAPFVAVKGISFSVAENEFFGIVGESGCGKSTVAHALCGLLPIASGSAHFAPLPKGAVQMIFQDATGSLNPRKTIRATLAEVLSVHHLCPLTEIAARITALLEEVGLPPEVALAYPRELSGGQCQRISIARALAMNPRVLIADEPVSALDVSVQARVLNLLADVRLRRNLTILLISHDLAVVRTVCDRLMVMHAGEIVEQGDARELFAHPRHTYTQQLLAAVPDVSAAFITKGFVQ